MSAHKFYQLLLFILGGTLITFQGVAVLFPNIMSHFMFFGIGEVFYVTLCLIGFYVAKKLTAHRNINLFSQFILLFVLNKMILTLTFIFIYVFKTKPIDKGAALIPFLFLYLVFTVFSVYFLSKIGKERV
jgi:hypothetical protein